MAFQPYTPTLPVTQPDATGGRLTNGFTPYSQDLPNTQGQDNQGTQTTQSPMPILTNPQGGFGTALKDVGVGFAKSFFRGTRDVASGIQSLGKFALNKAGVDTSNMGFQSVDNSNPVGAGVANTLQSKSRGEQVGGALETATELALPFSGGNAEKLVASGKDLYNTVKGVRAVASDASSQVLGKTGIRDVIDTVSPKLTKLQEAEAKASGRGYTSGILNKTNIAPSAREIEMGQYAKDAGVSSSNTFDKNIQLMKQAQQQSAETLRAGLRQAQGSWTRNDVVGALNDIKTPLTIKSDTTLTRLANNFKKAIVDLAVDANKKPEGLLDLRQSVDRLIDKEFPANIYSKDTPVGQYVREVRQSLNSMAESKLPEGKLPNGQTFKGELRRQNLLYDAIDNVAGKAPKAGESARPLIQKTKALVKKHPYITSAVIGGTAGGAIKGL